jgi:hypothetical protein
MAEREPTKKPVFERRIYPPFVIISISRIYTKHTAIESYTQINFKMHANKDLTIILLFNTLIIH